MFSEHLERCSYAARLPIAFLLLLLVIGRSLHEDSVFQTAYGFLVFFESMLVFGLLFVRGKLLILTMASTTSYALIVLVLSSLDVVPACNCLAGVVESTRHNKIVFSTAMLLMSILAVMPFNARS